MEQNKSAHARRLTDLTQQDGQLLRIMDAALGDAAQRAGDHLVCRPGCTQCCHGAFAIDALDALRLRTAMQAMRTVNPRKAAKIESRARDYLLTHGPDFPGDRTTGILGTSLIEEAAFEDFADEAACPALDPDTGLCEVYDARPMICRVFGPPVRVDSIEDGAPAYSVCELCFTSASPKEIADCAMAVPDDEEQRLLAEVCSALQADDETRPGETIVAFCLISERP